MKEMSNFTPTTGFVNIGEFFVCNCRVPLVKRTGLHEYEIVRYHGGQRVIMKSQFEGGVTKIKCKICGRGFNYIQLKETIGVVDNLRVVSTPARDIIKE